MGSAEVIPDPATPLARLQRSGSILSEASQGYGDDDFEDDFEDDVGGSAASPDGIEDDIVEEEMGSGSGSIEEDMEVEGFHQGLRSGGDSIVEEGLFSVPEGEERLGGLPSPGAVSIGEELIGEDITAGSGTIASEVYSEEFETAPGSVSDMSGGTGHDVQDYSGDAFEVDSEPNTPAHSRPGGAETVDDEFVTSIAESIGSEVDEELDDPAERERGDPFVLPTYAQPTHW